MYKLIGSRRDFLGSAALIVSGGLARLSAAPRDTGLAADVVIIGGGTGGTAAALSALQSGLRVILTEETNWIGGQMTAQAVPPDEHPWIEQFGATRRYRDYRTRVRDYYRRNYLLTAEARVRWDLNPGNGGVSKLCHEPPVSVAVLSAMLAPHVGGGRLVLLTRHKAVAAETASSRVRAVVVRSLETGRQTTLTAPYFLDATELGDLLPMTKTAYVTGFESRRQTGEPHAPEQAQPLNMQAFTMCFAVQHIEGEDHTIEKPADYDFWRSYRPKLDPPWPGPLLSFTQAHFATRKPQTREFDPSRERMGGLRGLWIYRRIADKENFVPGAYLGDITLVNWHQNDYTAGNICETSEEEAATHVRRAKQLSLSLLYWLQTEAPRHDGKQGWPGLLLRKDLMGSDDGLAQYPYVRESRRILAEFTPVEQHLSLEARMAATSRKADEVTAEPYPDSVGVGSYQLDLHPSSGGDNFITLVSLPFQIPLGALIPRSMDNLLVAAKNIGTTHITNGSFRLHPVEWNIGESAGFLAAFCLARKATPRQVRNTPELLAEFQTRLTEEGVEIAWPKVFAR